MPTQDEVIGYIQQLSNWGRWGEDDEIGTLNLITSTKRLEAVATVRDGISVGCARPIVHEGPRPDVQWPPLHYMIRSGESPSTGPASAATDFIGLVFHGLTVSHVDTWSHQFWDGMMYNNRPRSLVTTEQGSTACSVEAMKDGIVTRGVLLDITDVKGKPYMDASEPIFPEDLEAAEQAQGVRIGEGDAMIFRTGWYRRRVEVGPYPVWAHRPGLHAACLPWLRERGVAIVGADASHDVTPSGYELLPMPVHTVSLVAMGLPLLDSLQLEDLKATCVQRGRWEFMLVVAPLRIRYGTGSPANPIAVF
ncbi:MAG: cyclase family protein [Chloroflexi bacterium]|nr:cyclase family protein [Chloroflexota bacterium]